MRITFKLVEKLGRSKGLLVERHGKFIEICHKDYTGGVTAVCETVLDAYGTVYFYEPGNPL